jgi:hypothetical protein
MAPDAHFRPADRSPVIPGHYPVDISSPRTFIDRAVAIDQRATS